MDVEKIGLSRITCALSRWSNWISACALLAMVCLTFVDVFFRLFGYPITGRSEIVGFFLVLTVSLSLAQTEAVGANTSMQFVLRRFPARARAACTAVGSLMSLGVFVLLGRQCFVFAKRLILSGEVTSTLEVPFYPFLYVVVLGAGVLSLVLIDEIKEAIKEVIGR
jgi:TRAP-type C4-dicarboxylate transport system permease small subunit